jgi:FdhE protein
MDDNSRMLSHQIKKAVAALRDARPAYKEILDFYEKLFLAQEATKNDIRLTSIDIPKDLLLIKQKEKFPLVNSMDFPIDVGSSEALLRKFCQFAGETNEVLADAGAKIMDALDRGMLDASVLFSKILGEDAAYWDELAGKLNTDKKILAFAAYSSIRPCLCLCAEQLATYLDKERHWEKGYCPICGNPPALSILRGEGERSLLCSFCDHEWRSCRIFCPFCENKDQKMLHYFFGEEETECRVDVCGQCNKYIKTIDTRKMDRLMHPLVEQISTLHLDMLAQEKGLESGIALWFQT